MSVNLPALNSTQRPQEALIFKVSDKMTEDLARTICQKVFSEFERSYQSTFNKPFVFVSSRDQLQKAFESHELPIFIKYPAQNSEFVNALKNHTTLQLIEYRNVFKNVKFKVDFTTESGNLRLELWENSPQVLTNVRTYAPENALCCTLKVFAIAFFALFVKAVCESLPPPDL